VVDAEVDAYNRAIAEAAAATGAEVVDLFSIAQAAQRDGTEDDLISRDGLHPNDAGHRAVAAAFAQAYANDPSATLG
jgi:lysophospholipase L1-like esterase